MKYQEKKRTEDLKKNLTEDSVQIPTKYMKYDYLTMN